MRRPKSIFAIALLIAIVLTACTHKISKFYPEIVPSSQVVTVPLVPKGNQKVSITYLGTGNMVLEHNGEAIMTDPFFSNQKLYKSKIGKVGTKDHLYGIWKRNLESATARSAVQAMLVSHTHYDHVMDLPTMLHEHYFQNLKVVYGNRYLPKMLTNFRKEGVKLDSLKRSVVYDPKDPTNPDWNWISVTPHLRFLAIHTDHAPQTGKTLHMKGPLDSLYFKDKLVWANGKVRTDKWTVGDSYAFLIDFDTLRVYVQTSASSLPNGMPPAEILKEKQVDIAILCYANIPNVEKFPNTWITTMNPKKVIFVHWEDFFKDPPIDDKKYRLVRGTNPRKVRERIDSLGRKANFYIMPRPGTRIDVMF